MGYNMLSEINPTRYNWTIKVRAVRVWQVSGTSNKGKQFNSMELILVDEEGLAVTASIGQMNLGKFSKSISEGHSYCIRNFQVSKQERKFRAIPSTCTIYFTPWTDVKEIPSEVSTNLPLYVFNFVDFKDLDRRARHGDSLVDIIGQLTVVHPVVHSSSLNGPSVRREVELRDLDDSVLTVTLWGEHATSFKDEFLIETIDNDEPVVVIFAGMQARLFLGAPSCRSHAATKWYINIDIPEANAFRASLQGTGSGVKLISEDAHAAAGSCDEEHANRKTVSQLLSLNPHEDNDVRFTCHASIREIDVTNGWWYKGCSMCKKGLKPTLQGFECENCDESEPMIVPCYKLNVVIEDATGRAKIFMFGGLAEQVVRRTAAELVEESSSNQILLPAALRAIIGRSYVFQVVISEQTFRTGQLCFQARRLFKPSSDDANVTSTGADSGVSDPVEGPTITVRETTPPQDAHTSTSARNSSTRGKEASVVVDDEHGNVLGKRQRSARRELISSKKEKQSEE